MKKVTPELAERWRKQILNRGMSRSRIAAESGVSYETVRLYTRGVVPPRGAGRHDRVDIDTWSVVRARALGYSLRDIARLFDCSLNTVRQRLWEAGEGPDPKNRGRGTYAEYVRTLRPE